MCEFPGTEREISRRVATRVRVAPHKGPWYASPTPLHRWPTQPVRNQRGNAMPPKISMAEFEVLVAQAGLPLNAAQKQEIHQAYGLLESMLAHVNTPMPREAEPALIFVPEVR